MAKPLTLAAPPASYAAMVVTVGEHVWGRNWPSGMARLINCSPRTLQRLQEAARTGQDYRTARTILTQVSARLGNVATALKPWAK